MTTEMLVNTMPDTLAPGVVPYLLECVNSEHPLVLGDSPGATPRLRDIVGRLERAELHHGFLIAHVEFLDTTYAQALRSCAHRMGVALSVMGSMEVLPVPLANLDLRTLQFYLATRP